MATPPGEIVGVGSSELTQTEQPISCDGFYSPDDEMRHVITGTIGGDIVETFFNPNTGIGQTSLINVADLRSVGSFYTSDDCIRHVITADQNGGISEVYYSPKYGVSATALSTIANANRVSGFHTPDDNRRHAIVDTAAGDIFEIVFGKGIKVARLATVPDLMDVAGFYSSDDGVRRVIAASLDGTITEISYHSNEDVRAAVLAKIPGVRRIGAFYAPQSDFYTRRVLALYEPASTKNVCELRYRSGNDVSRNELGVADGAVDLGGFYSDDDRMSHCIIGYSSGESQELFY